MKIYISGKITNDPNYKEKFEKAVHKIIEQGNEMFKTEEEIQMFNPASITLPDNATWNDYMKYDLKILIDCDAIYMLKGWHESKGANLEFKIAQEMGKIIFFEE